VVLTSIKYLEDAHSITELICNKNKSLYEFWSTAHGWAPESAANLLESSMLKWQFELSETLKIWCEKGHNITDGELILAWTNLGALLEGSMKFFLCVYLEDYHAEEEKIKNFGKEILPDEAMLKGLIDFYKKKELFLEFVPLFEAVQTKRNAIHSFKYRDIGSFSDFENSLKDYYSFLCDIDGTIPYP
tara:strand:+ start:3102 stop:3665 length:564 start_codon:yes stop_codon:yes gene_type:complete